MNSFGSTVEVEDDSGRLVVGAGETRQGEARGGAGMGGENNEGGAHGEGRIMNNLEKELQLYRLRSQVAS